MNSTPDRDGTDIKGPIGPSTPGSETGPGTRTGEDTSGVKRGDPWVVPSVPTRTAPARSSGRWPWSAGLAPGGQRLSVGSASTSSWASVRTNGPVR